MVEDTKIKKEENKNSGFKPIPTGEDIKPTGFRSGQRGTGARRPGFGRAGFGRAKPRDEFDSKLLDLARVTRVTGGGKRMKFRAVVVVGNKKGKVGIGVDKGRDVSQAVEKATRIAKKNLTEVFIINETISHEVEAKAGPARILLKPQKKGRGLVAGGAVRTICDLAGIKNISSKILSGSKNKLNNARATIEALKKLRVK
jgi:small subunit ribosomal protein S5